MSTREQSAPAADRERRAELERLQVELREAKQALTGLEGAEPPELAALRERAARAGEQRAAALAKRHALETERAHLDAEARQLTERLKRAREEAQVLARGARLRDQQVDWANARNSINGPTDSTWVAQLVVAGGGMLLLITLGLLSVCGRH